MEKKTPYRTVVTTLALAAAVLVAILLLRDKGDAGARMFETAAWVFFAMTVPQAAKSGIEVLAKGGGVKGALNVLTTDAKPGEVK